MGLPYIVQYASRLFLHDLPNGYFHQSWNKLIKPVKNANLLILCGDIGFRQAWHTHNFIHYCALHWPKVIWIEGEFEKEKNIDGDIPRILPQNVQYVSDSILINLDHTYPLFLYASPSNSLVKDLAFFREECNIMSDNILNNIPFSYHFISSTYNASHQILDMNPPNCIGWIQGVYDIQNIKKEYMRKISINSRFQNKKRIEETTYSPMKYMTI